MPEPSARKVPTGPLSMQAGSRQALVYQANGAPWNGPGEAPPSSVPVNAPSRSWPYPILWNASGDPRAVKVQESGGISFADVQALSDQVHVRAAIETVKNAQCKKEWLFVPVALPGERATDTARRAQEDPRIAELTEFFEQPDGEHDLAEWCRLLFEDCLVIDAATVHNVRRNNGKPYELEVFPGASIKPLIGEDGRTPRPPKDAYQQWLYGAAGDKFTRAEMMYAPRNPRPGKVFGKSPVEQLCLYINIALRKDMQRLATYTDGNIPAGLLPMPQDWKPAEIMDWWTNFSVFIKGLPANLVKMIPIPGGTGNPIFPAIEATKDQWEESWIRLVCFAFDISVSSLVKEMNRATAEVGRDQAEQDGAAAYTDWFRRRLNWIIRNWFGYRDIVAKQKREVDVDLLKQTQADEINLRQGSLQVNEKREREGMPVIEALEGKYGYFGPSGWMEFGAQAPTLSPFGMIGGVGGAAAGTASPPPPVSATPPAADIAATPVPVTAEPLRVGDINAAQLIVKDVAAGTVPRDAGMGQLKLFFKFTDDEAALIMGSAGLGDVPTTPNPVTVAVAPAPGATAGAAADDASAPEQQKAAGDDVEKQIEEILKLLRGDDGELQKLVTKYTEKALIEGAQQVASATAFTDLVTIDDEQVRAFLEQRENLITSVNEETGNEILRKIKDLQNDEGASPEEISRIIEETYDLRSDQADLIANQEVGSSLNGGRYIQLEEEGVEEHEWLTSGKGNVRPSHQAIEGERRKVGEKFSNGCRYPQDPSGPADEVIGCVCITLPVFDSTKAETKPGADVWREAMKPVPTIEKELAEELRTYFAAQRVRVLKVVA